jgi:hypothetical protein
MSRKAEQIELKEILICLQDLNLVADKLDVWANIHRFLKTIPLENGPPA